jgi:hypothetical protein
MASDTFVLEKSRLLIIGQQLFHFGACELRSAELGRQAKVKIAGLGRISCDPHGRKSVSHGGYFAILSRGDDLIPTVILRKTSDEVGSRGGGDHRSGNRFASTIRDYTLNCFRIRCG